MRRRAIYQRRRCTYRPRHTRSHHTALISCFPVAVATGCRIRLPVPFHFPLSLISNLSWANPSFILFFFSSSSLFPPELTKKVKEKQKSTRRARCLAPDFLWERSGDKEIKAWPCERGRERADKDGVYLPGGTRGDWAYQSECAALTCAKWTDWKFW